MSDIDRDKMNAFGFNNGVAASLLPPHIRRIAPKRRGDTNSSSVVYNKLYGNSKDLSTVDEKGEEGQDEEQEMDPDELLDDLLTDEEGDVQNCSEDNVDADEHLELVQNRERSKRIKPVPSSDLGNRRPTDDSSSVVTPQQEKPSTDRRKFSLVSWLVGSRSSGSKPTDSAKSKKSMWWFRPSQLLKQEKAEVVKGIGLWASTSCFFVYMMLSRQSRMELVIRSSKLSVYEGERVNYLLYKLKPKYLNAYYELRKQLTVLCSKLLSPPTTLKEFTQLSQIELHALFKSQGTYVTCDNSQRVNSDIIVLMFMKANCTGSCETWRPYCTRRSASMTTSSPSLRWCLSSLAILRSSMLRC